MKIGVLLNSFSFGSFDDDLEAAAKIGFDGVQLFATDPLSREEIKDRLKNVKDKGMVFSAICAHLGGYNNADTNADKIVRIKKLLDQSLELECGIVTTHIGRIPFRSEDPGMYDMMLSAVTEIGNYADSVGAKVAVETGHDKAYILRHFIEDTGCKNIGINLDPANLVMCAEDNAAAAAGVFSGMILHTHAKDGIALGCGKFKEVPIGQGAVHFDEFLPALHYAGYDGFLTIEREHGQDRVRDVALAAEFLRQMTERYDIYG